MTLTCKKCGKLYWSECKFGSKAFYKCGDPNHKSFKWKKEIHDVESYSFHEKGHINIDFLKRKNEVIVPNAGKKVEPRKVKGRVF